MATLKQKRVARKIPKIIESGEPITGGELVASAGYSEEMQRKPGQVLNSPGVQLELGKLGFTEDKAREVVGLILSDSTLKPEPRLKAAEMVFKVHGTFAPDKSVTINLDADSTERTRELGDRLSRLFRRRN